MKLTFKTVTFIVNIMNFVAFLILQQIVTTKKRSSTFRKNIPLQMPLTPAERQRRYRERLKQSSAEKLAEIRRKNRERRSFYYHSKKKNAESTEELQRKWRESKQKKGEQASTSGPLVSSSAPPTLTKEPLTAAERPKIYREKLKATDVEKYEQIGKKNIIAASASDWLKKKNEHRMVELRCGWRECEYEPKARKHESAMSLASDLIVKVEPEEDAFIESADFSCQPVDSRGDPVKEEPADPQPHGSLAVGDESSMSLASDLIVKVEPKEHAFTESADFRSQPVDSCGDPVKEEPAEPQPHGSLAVGDPLTSDPLRTLASFNLEPTPVEVRNQSLSERLQDGKFPPIPERRLHAECKRRYTNEKFVRASVNRSTRSSAISEASGSIGVYEVAVEYSEGSEYQPKVSSDLLDVPVSPVSVHGRCRQQYTNDKLVNSHVRSLLRREVDPDAPPLQEEKAFDYVRQCLVCACDATPALERAEEGERGSERAAQGGKGRGAVRRVTRVGTGQALYRASLDYPGPDSEELRKRLFGKDLIALQARYHAACYRRFLCGRARGHSSPAEVRKRRPISETLQAEFIQLCDYIENNWEDSQFHQDELKLPCDTNARTLMRKFEDRYGTALHKRDAFVVSPGFTVTDDWYRQKLTDEENERLRIVRTAANIILEDIRSIVFDNKSYPPPSSFLDDVGTVIPETLKTFVDTVVTKYKNNPEDLNGTMTALSHSIMTAARPKTFKSPLLLGIGSFINQKHTSKSLIEMLSSIGFCAPYNDVTQFEISVAYKEKSETKSQFSQFAFDAVDTEINGQMTQALVGVQCVTPSAPDVPIPRKEHITPREAEWWCSKTGLETYVHGTSGLKNVTMQDHRDDTAVLPTKLDALWLFGKSDPSLNLPSWDGFINKIKNKESPLSEIRPLPVIRAPASYDAVYTALKHASRSPGVSVVTFGQPLYQIAQDIVNSDQTELSNVVLRLGGFHIMMSYLGAIGYIMSGSGLEQSWCGIYAAEQTGKMMTGHAFARAVRAHFLTRSALFNIIIKDFDLTPEQKLEIECILEGNPECITQAKDNDPGIQRYKEPLAITLESLEKRGPTAQLWVQYFQMTTLLAQFIEAERTANWDLHLSTLKKMFPYFHASGHFEYAKSCSLYLQDMQKLETKMSPEEYESFTRKGYFTVRTTDKLWTDVWSDLLVERSMARLMGRPGGVAGGRTVTDDVLGHWTEAGPTLSAVADLVQGFCSTSEHRAFVDEPSRNTDNDDVVKLQNWFEEHNPFTETESLVSIGTGVMGGSEVRCHEAGEIGKRMMAKNVGRDYHNVSYQKKSCVLPLSSINSAIRIENFKVPIEPDTILKRIRITKENQEEMKSYFNYELAPYPLSLFNDLGMLEDNKKSELFECFVGVEIAEGGSRSHVIDGVFLLHRVPWKEADVTTIINTYVEYVKANHSNAVVVFGGLGRKETIVKRSKVKSKSTAVDFQKDTVLTINQETFLSNERNRDKLVQYLLIEFTRSGIIVKLSPNDVYAYIVQTATERAATFEETCVVSDDPDLLVVMTARLAKKNVYFMKPGRGKTPTTYYHVDSFGSNKVKLSIMFIHAVCGTDSTSVMFRKTRTSAFLSISSMHSKEVKHLMAIFKDPNADPDAIAEAGYRFLQRLYHYKGDNVPVEDLNVVRFEKFTESLTKSGNHLAFLPPTKEAARQHMYRTYHQIQKWLGNDLPATDWGWELVGDRLVPITTLAAPAPRELLDLISCKCDNICTSECTCKRADLDCCVLCVNCNGKVCHGVDMDLDAYEEGYRILSGCDALGNPVDFFELNHSSTDSIDEDSESEPHSKRPRRGIKEEPTTDVEPLAQ